MNNIFVGWSSRDITPSEPVKLQGQFYERISEYVNDPITATALAIESREGEVVTDQLIIVSCDLAMVSREIQEAVKESVRSKISDFNISKLFLNATHTHTAPVLHEKRGNVIWELSQFNKLTGQDEDKQDEDKLDNEIMSANEYVEFLVERVTDAVIDAWENRQPGGVSWALDYAVVGHNRRIVYNDGSAKMYGTTDIVNFDSLEGASDHGVELLYFWNEVNELSGIAINVCCPSQVVEHKRFISADYWGEVRKEIRRRHSDNIFILPLCGSAGDQSPRDLVRRGRGDKDMYDLEGMKEIGTRIADAVDRKLDIARNNINKSVCFRHIVEEVKLSTYFFGYVFSFTCAIPVSMYGEPGPSLKSTYSREEQCHFSTPFIWPRLIPFRNEERHVNYPV
jgi:hypothetical protein